jgi:hypothetical protein
LRVTLNGDMNGINLQHYGLILYIYELELNTFRGADQFRVNTIDLYSGGAWFKSQTGIVYPD